MVTKKRIYIIFGIWVYVVKCVRRCWGWFWAGMIELTPGAKLVSFLPWIVLGMTRHVVQVVHPQAQPKVYRPLTSGPAVTCFPTAVCSRTLYTVCKLLKK